MDRPRPALRGQPEPARLRLAREPCRGNLRLGSDCPPMGLRVRLKKSVDISRFSTRMQVVLRALQHYGMFVADNTGGSTAGGWPARPIPAGRTRRTSPSARSRGSDFEVVAHGDIQSQ